VTFQCTNCKYIIIILNAVLDVIITLIIIIYIRVNIVYIIYYRHDQLYSTIILLLSWRLLFFFFSNRPHGFLSSVRPYAKCSGCRSLAQCRINDFPTPRHRHLYVYRHWRHNIFQIHTRVIYFFIQTTLTPMTCGHCCIHQGEEKKRLHKMYIYVCVCVCVFISYKSEKRRCRRRRRRIECEKKIWCIKHFAIFQRILRVGV